MSKTLIIADYKNNRLKKSTLSAITFAKQAGIFDIAVLGEGVADLTAELIHFGAEKVHVMDDSNLKHYLTHEYSTAVTHLAKTIDATHIIMGDSWLARDMMPQVACRLKAGMANNVIDFEDGRFKRTAYAGSVVETIQITTPVKVIIVSSTAFEAAQPEIRNESPTERVRCSVTKGRVKVIDKKNIQSDRPQLTEAEVVVSGGRGLKTPDNKKILEKFADKLGAAIGWSRAAVDSGWAPTNLQVGQTGKAVAPSLYIAVGISGSVQHLAGMKDSKTIVAINKDEDAPIFANADYGIVGDLSTILPELTKKIPAH